MSAAATVERRPGRLPGELADAVRALAATATRADGVGPLNEAGLLALDHGGTGRAHHLLRSADGLLAGYAGVDLGETPVAVELVVDPTVRRQGFGRQLLDAVRAAEPGDGVGFWAHGDLPAARALAVSTGLGPVRRLLRLRRPAGTALPPVALPDGVALAPFRPGADDAEWLRVNSAAFAHHPEQGRWDAGDLAARVAADWFDPAGFLLARSTGGRDGRLLGSIWTKVDPADPGEGEIYVLGVDPAAGSAGLGTALAGAGLRALADRGVGDVLLYVEGDSPAVRLYRRLGFLDDTVDVLWV